jgi:hypothetical protein
LDKCTEEEKTQFEFLLGQLEICVGYLTAKELNMLKAYKP